MGEGSSALEERLGVVMVSVEGLLLAVAGLGSGWWEVPPNVGQFTSVEVEKKK